MPSEFLVRCDDWLKILTSEISLFVVLLTAY
jgi:hypothetical protein